MGKRIGGWIGRGALVALLAGALWACEKTEIVESTELASTGAEIEIGDRLYAVVGDTLRVYHYSILQNPRADNYILSVSCEKGRNFEDYWRYEPQPGDEGETALRLAIYDFEGTCLDERTVTVVTRSARNPARPTHVLCLGNSLMADGQTPIELSRRLKGTAGVATWPAPLDLSNFKLVGRKHNEDSTVGWEGTSGYTWKSYEDLDVREYVETHCGGQLDYVYLQLGTNELLSQGPFEEVDWIVNGARKLIDRFHEAYPACRIMLGSVLLPSQEGGLGWDYAGEDPNAVYGSLGYGVKAHRLNTLYQALANEGAYRDFLIFIDNNAQYDCRHVYPTLERPSGNYLSRPETVGTNGVHPMDVGYWQIAGGIFRALVSLASE